MKAKQRAARKPVPVPDLAPRRPLWPYALGLFLAVFAAFEVYGPVLHGPFVFDDQYLPFRIPGFSGQWSNWVKGVRPLLMFTYWANFRYSGGDTYSYHVCNVIFHIGASLLIWRILDRLLEMAGVEKARRMILSAFGGALFLLHPVQTESVSYVASRSENLSVMLFLAAFAVFLRRRQAAVSWRVAAAVLGLFVAALASKEHTLVLPALLLLTDYYWNPGFSLRGMRRNWRIYVPLGVGSAAGLAFIWPVIMHSASAGFALKEITWYEYLFTECRALFVYLRLMVLPYGQTIDYDFPVSRTIFAHGALAGLVALLLMTGAAWYYRRRYPLASYGWFCFLILMAPTSSILPIRDPVAERRLYLSMIGLLLIAMEGLRRVRMSRAALAAALSAAVLGAAGLTYHRNLAWSDQITLWEDAARKTPAKSRVQFQLAYAYYEAGRCAEALPHYQRVAELEKPTYNLLVDWAEALDCAGQPDAAIARLQQAAGLESTAHIYSQIGMVYAKHSKWQEALDALAEAQRISPSYAMTYVYRGNVRESLRDFRAADEEYRRALAFDPNNQVAREALMRVARRLPAR